MRENYYVDGLSSIFSKTAAKLLCAMIYLAVVDDWLATAIIVQVPLFSKHGF